MQDLKITIIQTAIYWENTDKNLEMFSEKLQNVRDTDLIVLPEMFTTGFSMNSTALAEDMDGKTVNWMQKTAEQKKCVVTGSAIIRDDGNYYNRLIWMRPDGSFDIYDKRHLFRIAGEQNHYSKGKKKLIVSLNGWKIRPLICYDLRFPVWSRNRILNAMDYQLEYDVLIYIANWPEARRTAWNTLLQARAHENQAYVIGLNRISNDGSNISYAGDSAVIDPKGEILSKTKPFCESAETIILSQKMIDDFRKKFPVCFDADDFNICETP